MRVQKLPILCYHKCGPASAEGRRLNVEPARLASHVRFLRRRGFGFVLAGDLADRWPDQAACLTFDDAYVSTLEHGFEVLRSLGVRASVYPVTARVGGIADWQGGDGARLADWEALLAAHRDGFEIGSHTATHPALDAMDEAAQRAEIGRSLTELRERGIEPRSFCHPYGRHNAATLEALQTLGVPVGLALGRRPATAGDPRLRLPRIAVAYSDGLPMLVYKLTLKPLLAQASGKAK
ncbi:MAG: polysaccharide deacetylase family protein [Fimbriimonadales bacterium]|nr:polysaccharide deacetylase family protein [Fimbriimonadales bacterium]